MSVMANDVEQVVLEGADEGAVSSEPVKINGSSRFSVSLSPAGLVVQTVFLSEDNAARPLPAIFPSLGYALEQVDSLRNLVIAKFNEAAAMGMHSLQTQAAASAAPQPEGKDEVSTQGG